MNFAAIEIGSNEVRMIVGKLTDSCELRVLERWSAHLCLGDSVFENGVIPENIVQQLEQTILGLLQESQKFSQVKVSLSATSAMRDAENRNEVVSRLKTLVGHPVKILSGKEESQCLLEGVKSFLPQTLFSKFPLKQTILADLGGGSLEISLLESASNSKNSRNNFLHSFDIGTLRLKKMNSVLQQLESSLTEELTELKQLYSVNPQDSSHLILTGGNAKTFARLFTKVSTKYVSDKSSTNLTENWLSMDCNEFERIEQMFQQQSVEEQQARLGLRLQQTEVFNIALTVFRIIGERLRTNRLSIPFFGLKESLLLNLVSANIKKSQEDITLVLTSRPPKKFKIST
jgi:exopolyphosphatase/guanosine-5'-triphosphate,3'-diphosphate pyrophosphatase